MANEVDLKKIVTNLSKVGVKVTMTKSRLEMLKALAPPTQPTPTQG
ncbi:Lmo0850 family protein [Paenisporosarcina cavernae]|nr:Lmo0850 family protein [Paenisporosarcina cavernae]